MEPMTWTSHPARTRPRDLALVLAVAFTTAGAVLLAFHSLFLVVLAVTILTVSVAAFLFPTHYVISDWGVQERRLGRRRERPWRDLRRVQIGPGAVLLSPFHKATWMDRYRGLLLHLDGADRRAVIECIRGHMHACGKR